MFAKMFRSFQEGINGAKATQVLLKTYGLILDDAGHQRMQGLVQDGFADLYNEHELAIKFLADFSREFIDPEYPKARPEVLKYVRIAKSAQSRGLILTSSPLDALFKVAHEKFGIDHRAIDIDQLGSIPSRQPETKPAAGQLQADERLREEQTKGREIERALAERQTEASRVANERKKTARRAENSREVLNATRAEDDRCAIDKVAEKERRRQQDLAKAGAQIAHLNRKMRMKKLTGILLLLSAVGALSILPQSVASALHAAGWSLVASVSEYIGLYEKAATQGERSSRVRRASRPVQLRRTWGQPVPVLR